MRDWKDEFIDLDNTISSYFHPVLVVNVYWTENYGQLTRGLAKLKFFQTASPVVQYSRVK